MKHKINPVKKTFSSILRQISIVSWILKLIPVPVDVLTAALMAKVVSQAAAGKVHAVLSASLILFAVVIGMKIFQTVTGILYEQAASGALHRCKITLYDIFLTNPLSVLYRSGHGETIEKLHDDFNTVTGRDISLFPSFWVSIIRTAVYFVFLSVQSIPIAAVLFVISVLQVVPPVIVKKYMQQNYDDNRAVEAELTEYTVEGYYGFAAIKLYGLKDWWLNGLKSIHKRYLRIGSKCEAACAAENAMDAFVSNILRYGAYGIIGLFILYGLSSMEVGVEAIALSGGFFGAVKTVFDSIPSFAVAKTAERRLSGWFTGVPMEKPAPLDDKIILKNVSLSFGERMIFNHADAVIDTSKVNLIRGMNGAGKSTLLRLIVGLIPPDAGYVTVCGGRAGQSRSPYHLFYLPQEDAVFRFSAREFYTMICGDPSEAVRYAHQFGLTDALLDQFSMDTLSGGERKKVFLSLAFAVDPPVLLLDEPANSLDDAGKKLLCRLLGERKSGAIVITHDEILNTAADVTYVVKEGRVTKYDG